MRGNRLKEELVWFLGWCKPPTVRSASPTTYPSRPEEAQIRAAAPLQHIHSYKPTQTHADPREARDVCDRGAACSSSFCHQRAKRKTRHIARVLDLRTDTAVRVTRRDRTTRGQHGHRSGRGVSVNSGRRDKRAGLSRVHHRLHSVKTNKSDPRVTSPLATKPESRAPPPPHVSFALRSHPSLHIHLQPSPLFSPVGLTAP